MNGVILIPSMFDGRTYVTDRYMCLFEMVRRELGYNIMITDTTDALPGNIDIIVTFKSPQHTNPDTFMNLTELHRKTKIVGYFSDLHSFGNKRYEENMARMLERCDVILCPYDEAFRATWPDYVDKYIWFPHFFAPHDRYAGLPYNRNPLYRCLLSGSVAPPQVYPLRRHIKTKGNRGKITVMDHPGYRRTWLHTVTGNVLGKKHYMRDSYAEEINKYFCSIATASIYRYVVAKYFEIPAAGTLMLANETEDVKKLGFLPFEHYVPITQDTALARIDECLSEPQQFEKIRERGMCFVRDGHSINNRFQTLKYILENVS